MSDEDHTKSPRYGYRECEICGARMPLKIQRDLTRKKTCSSRCRSLRTARLNLESGAWPPVHNDETKKQHAATLVETWKRQRHPWLGRKHSEETVQKVSESQKQRLAEHPEKIMRGVDHPNWTGGKTFNGSGYVLILHHGKYRCEHRVVAEEMIGRPLTPDEHVHHKNRNRADNRPENLEVLTGAEHISMHMKERWIAKKLQS